MCNMQPSIEFVNNVTTEQASLKHSNVKDVMVSGVVNVCTSMVKKMVKNCFNDIGHMIGNMFLIIVSSVWIMEMCKNHINLCLQ